MHRWPSRRSSARQYLDNVNATALRASSVVIECRLVRPIVALETKLALTRDIANGRHFLDSKHNQSNPRSNAPHMPIVGIPGKEVINEMIGDPLRTGISKLWHKLRTEVRRKVQSTAAQRGPFLKDPSC